MGHKMGAATHPPMHSELGVNCELERCSLQTRNELRRSSPGSAATEARLRWPIGPGRFCGSIFNHPTYGLLSQAAVNNNPDDPTFGGINGKTGSRIMQLGLRLFL